MPPTEQSIVRASAASPSGRRLSAIAFADIVGYTLMMGADEAGTMRRWTWLLDHVLRPATDRHGGVIVKTTGDGVLAEFASAFDAVEWGQAVQQALVTQDVPAAGSRPLALRISVHVGDVIASADDIYGDGVNIAARLVALANPGGIVISEMAYSLLRGAIGSQARDLGFLNLKNVDTPIRAYALDVALAAETTVRPREGGLPSIAVLPLQNLSGDAADDYFAEGIVEDIIVSLGGLNELLVIARGSTLMYRNRLADPREVGRTLGVRYVLSGSVRRSSQSIRVSVHLCHASTGSSIWSERMQAAHGELFDMQDRIVERIVRGIAPSVRGAELAGVLRRHPESFSAYDCTLRALEIMHQLDAGTFPEALTLLQRAMAEDPKFAMPVAWAARWWSLHVGQGWSGDPPRDIATAASLALKAIELDRKNALALATYGHLKSFLFHDCDTALIYLDRALEVAPNNALAWLLKAGTLSYLGHGPQAVQHAENALRLSPFDSDAVFFYTFLSLAHYADGSYANAIKWGRMAISVNPSYTACLRILAAAHAGAGETAQAAAIASRILEVEPDFRLDLYSRSRQPFQAVDLARRYMEHLRDSGLPQ